VNEWNDKTAEITGYTKEEAFDCSLVETFIVPYMQNSVQDVLDNALQGRGTSNFELEFRTKSNEIRHLLVNATTRRDAENHVVGVVGVAQDVTEAVQRDRAVAGMALELRQLIDTANAPIFGIDIDGNVNEWNRRTQEITGYSKEETFDEPLVESFIARSMRQRVQEILDAALQGNETSNYELEFVSKCGEPRFMLVNATTRRDPEFNVVGGRFFYTVSFVFIFYQWSLTPSSISVVGVAQDVTEDRKHSAELRKMQYLQATQEAKVETERNMTAYFAHELRNPLGAIDSALKSMPDDLPETAKDLVAGMQLCSSFMSSIMNNLLDVRKMEEGKMTLNAVPISLKKLLGGVHKMLNPSMKPGVSFVKQCDTVGKDWVFGDEHRIQQVITNVVTNAIKYTVSGSITICIGWEGVNVKFECIDTGPGIPKSEQEKLFQRFVQRGGAPGTGLGLAIAKHLVDLAGGSIRFDSDPSVKAGTSCIVLMPLDLCEPVDMPAKENLDEVPFLEEPLSFLIVDDMKMNRMMLKRRIMKGIAPNCSVREAATGEEALVICGKEQFDIIVVDQYMEEAGGVMVGTDVVYAMRRMRIESIIIGCSGNDLDEEFREAGADWVWQKPMPSNKTIITRLGDEMAKRRL
jgi:PAS domain S-box-containing protein